MQAIDGYFRQLLDAAREGHLCIPCPEEITLPHDMAVWQDGVLYLKRLWELQESIVEHVMRLRQDQPKHPLSLSPDSDLLPEQAAFIDQVDQHSLTLLCGGPGTGKSYTLTRLIQQARELKIALAAPTGKAIANLRAIIDNESDIGTLHALLSLREGRKAPRPKWLAADLVVVDEASMIDVQVMAQLLASIKPGARLVLVGDPHQLPPVEAGQIFADLVSSLPSVVSTLTRCMRTDRAELIQLAQAVSQGNEEAVLSHLKPLDAFDLRSCSAHILTPIHHGPYGVRAINEKRMRAQPKSIPILILRNSAQLDLYNGDIGELISKDYAQFGNRRIPVPLLPPHQPAFALSIHKSQGSEYKDVAILLPPGSEKFGRELLYTAVTRARHTVTLYGDPDTVRAILSQRCERRSQLSKLLLSMQS